MKTYYCDRLVLNVQKSLGVCGSPFASLPYNFKIVEYGFQFIWCLVGYAAKSFGYVIFLARLV